jgi:hypothetical protein
MNFRANQLCKWIGVLSISLATGLIAGCDDTEFDREPPAGQGSLIVDNFTGDRVRVYIEGVEDRSVSSGDHRYYDREPGVYRVALDGDDIRRYWAGDVDVLEGRRTVLEVRGYSSDFNSFDVRIYLD